jgi:hypothetical protein
MSNEINAGPFACALHAFLRCADSIRGRPRDHVPVPQNAPHCARPRALIVVRAHNGELVCVLYTEQVAALRYYNANALATPAEYIRDC